jgi:hypothetical protein
MVVPDGLILSLYKVQTGSNGLPWVKTAGGCLDIFEAVTSSMYGWQFHDGKAEVFLR